MGNVPRKGIARWIAKTKPKRDQEHDKFYDSSAWRKVRRLQLIAHPVCKMCAAQDRITPANVVDHIIPIKQGGEQLRSGNLQSLCERCHAIKSNQERRGQQKKEL